jgi:hypothetical protein
LRITKADLFARKPSRLIDGVEITRKSSRQKMFVIMLLVILLGGSAGLSIAITEAFLPIALAAILALGALSVLKPKITRKRK